MFDESSNKATKGARRRSLRTVLILWFLVFTIIPLIFMALFSVLKVESAVYQELKERIESNFREVSSRFRIVQSQLKKTHLAHTDSRSLQYYMVRKRQKEFEKLLLSWVKTENLTEASVFDVNGKAQASVINQLITRVKTSEELSSLFLSQEILPYMVDRESIYISDLRENNSLEFVAFSKILTPQKALLGYLRETVVYSSDRIKDLSDGLSVEILFNKKGSDIIVTSLRKSFPKLHKGSASLPGVGDAEQNLVELNLDGQPYAFMSKQLLWDDDSIILSIGVSKRRLLRVLDDVNYTFIGVFAVIIVLLVLLSFIISRVILRPLRELVNAVNKEDPGSHLVRLPVLSNDEIGQLTQSFNKTFNKIYDYQSQLKENIFDLQKTNEDILNAQTKAVQTAKMASLGQLVAGVAHELNNPISFIYSNMGHLKEYSEFLIKIIEDASLDKSKKLKEELDYDYVVKDLPKLIESCEDGAKRTRDIVLGLRNFSRLEDSQSQEVDIHEGLESALRLLHSELQKGIEVVKNYGDLPKVSCYPGELNQVFMNILSNAAQAIPKKGKIELTTELVDDGNFVRIIISDNGEGMSQSVQEKIFDPFYTTKPIGVGTGLGLSISYGIINKHGGTISVDSKEGLGTSFAITIAVKTSKNKEKTLA